MISKSIFTDTSFPVNQNSVSPFNTERSNLTDRLGFGKWEYLKTIDDSFSTYSDSYGLDWRMSVSDSELREINSSPNMMSISSSGLRD